MSHGTWDVLFVLAPFCAVVSAVIILLLQRYTDRLKTVQAIYSSDRAGKSKHGGFSQAAKAGLKNYRSWPADRKAAISGPASYRSASVCNNANGTERPAILSKVFLSYRREDAQDAAGRLHDRLVGEYGSDRVFMDVDSMPLGVDFIARANIEIAQSSVVIVIIGRQWLTVEDKRDRRRLNLEDDLVRAEVRAALQQEIPVIPIIVQNASMPDADDLPDDIRSLTRRSGIHLRPEQWHEGVERLIKELDKIMCGGRET